MAELDLSGLTPLDASGLKPISRETPPLDAAGLKRLDVSGLKPLVDTSLTDYPVEFAKGFVEGAKNLPAASLKGAAALQQEIAVQGLQRLDEMERQRTSDMLGQSLDDPFARAAQRTRRSVLGRMTPETIAERREFLTEQANRPLTEHPLYRAGEVIEEFGKETLAPRPGFEGSWTRDIGAGFGSFGAGVATAFLNPAAAALMWVTAGSGEAVENAVKAGATPEQIRRAAVLGTVPGATDAVDAMIPMLGSTGKVMGLLKRVGWGTLKGVLAEGGQEGLQQFLQNLIARGVYDPNKDLTEDVPRSAIIGAIVGGTVGGGFAAAQRQPVAQEPGDSAARGDLAAPGQWWAPEAPPPEQRPTIPSGAIPAETILPPAADAEPAPIQPVAPTAETQPKAETQPIGNAPPEASTGRFVLEALLKDPRTAAEIRADIEQALRWQPSEQWQPVPPLLARPLVDTPDLPFEIKLIDGVLQARLKPPPGSRTAPIELTSPEDVNRGAERTIEPTPAQAEAGNYPKRHLKWQGLEIAIETEAGGTRSGMGKDGVPWSVTLAHPYGYIKRTEGKDGDQIDVYVGPNPDSDRVFIIDQIDPDTRRFDEHKLVIGAETAEQAEAIYLSGFSDGSGAHRLGAMSELSVAELKTWLAEGNNRRPFAYVAPKRPPQRRAPLSLFEFLASRGGIREYRGELATLGLDRVFVPGFGRLVRPSGMPLDRAREAAVEAGYLFDPGWNTDQPSRSTINDLLNLLDQEARGTKVYSANDQEALAERAAKEAKRVAAEHLDLARYRVGEAVAHLGIKNFTDEEERAAVELVLRGADPVDAVVEVVERSAIANEDAVLSSPQETEHADDAGRADTQGAESAAAGEQQTPAVPSPAPRAAPQRLQPPGAESGGGQAQETGAAAEPAGPQRREVKPQPAAPRSAFADMATRIENARRSFINTLVELAGISEAEAAAVTDFYLKKNMAKLDAVGGRITVKHGSYLDPDAIRRALKEAIEQRPSAKPAAPAAQETTAGPSGKRWTAIGKNKDGHTLYEDENGVRSYVENGIRHVEPVPITPTRAGITVIKPEHREPWRLASEIETPQAAEPAAPAKQVEKQEPPSLPAKLAELGGALAGWLKAGRSLTSRVLQEQAEKVLGARLAEGKFDRKDIADALELAVNIMVRDNAQLRIDGAPNAESALSQLDQLLKRLPTQRVRSEEQEALQQFSTPPHYAAAAVYAANLKDGDVVLEPSAGTGSLVAAAMAPKVEIIANEISPRRIALLRRLIGERGRIFTENAEQIDNILPDDVRPTVVLMNPPFSRAGARMGEHKVPMLAAEHVQAALKRLQPGGRLVAIVNGGFTMGGRYRAWWDQIGKDHTVVANIGVAGRVYEKYGTAFPTRLLVIDKVPPNEGHRPLLAEAQTVDELLRILEPIRNARATAPAAQPQADQPSGARPSAGGEGGRGAGLPAPAQSSLLGPGERGGGRLAGTGTPRAGATGAPAVRVEAGERPALDVLQPERPGRPERAGERPVGGDQPRIEPAQRGGDGAQRDLEPAGGRQPGAATSGERIALEVAAPTKQTGDLSEAVYQPYKPQRLRLPGAKPHPSPLVESASMASVLPPTPTYQPHLPKYVLDKGLLSLEQIEVVVYAGQAHAQMLPAAEGEKPRRRGYFIGDGTGVGKGREVAGIILDNFAQGRQKAVWVSESRHLIEDAKRDWSGLQQDAKLIFNLGNVRPGEKINADRGIAFLTYDTLKTGMADQAALVRGNLIRRQRVTVNGQAGVVQRIQQLGKNQPAQVTVKLDNGTEVTESARNITPLEQATVQTRIDQLVQWLGADFDGVIAFDEAHNMGNATATAGARGLKEAAQKALAGLELQRRLPNARVVYISATGATEVSNLAYAERLGLWGRGTSFADRNQFIQQIDNGGIAAMEVVACDLKRFGLYTARNLSFDGVEYDRVEHVLTENQREIYNTLAEAWQVVLRNINVALAATQAPKSARSNAYSAFWGAHQRFFNQIVTSMQMPSVIKVIEQDLAAGRQVVLQLTNTNEASQERAAAKATSAEELEELDITPRDQIIQLVQVSFPTQQYEEYVDADGKKQSRKVVDSAGAPVQNKEAVAMREALIERLAALRVPQGPLDLVLDHFGADNVAEITGRKRRFVLETDDAGNRRRVEQSRGSKANLVEADAFQEGKKKILIFSQAGGTGRSYHADNTSPSKDARRVHYLVQSGWRADKAVQGFGRTHRTNQASAPIFKLVTTDLQGQKRFISSIARRLAQLGALTKGQRQTGDQGLFSARDNLENREARDALIQFYVDLSRGAIPAVSIDEFEHQTGLRLRERDSEGNPRGGLKQDLPPITQFLNRLLSLKIELQNRVFAAFSERLDRLIEVRREAGLLDVGLETIRADKIEKVSEQVVHRLPNSDIETKYVQFKVSKRFRPLSFDQVAGRDKVRFFVTSSRGKIYAVTEAPSMTTPDGDIVEHYRLYNPVSGGHLVKRDKIDKNWTRIERAEAERMWQAELKAAPEFITEPLHLITGAILPIWDRLEGSPRVMRLKDDNGEHYIGRVIPNRKLASTLQKLGVELKGEAREQLSPERLFARLTEGAQVTLANGWRLRRARVADQWRIELRGPATYTEGMQVKQDGVFSERINYQMRYFVPTDAERGPQTIRRLIEHRPVVEVSEPTAQTGQAETGEEELLTVRRQPAADEAQSLSEITAADIEAMTQRLRQRRKLERDLTDIVHSVVGSHAQVRFVDRLPVTKPPQGWGSYGAKVETSGGSYLPGERLITIAVADPAYWDPDSTAYHEAFHVVEHLLLNEAEMTILRRAEPRLREIARAFARLSQREAGELAGYEVRAVAFQAYAAARINGEPLGRFPASVRAVFEKLRLLFERIANYLRGLGYRTAEDVFADVFAGRMATRPAREEPRRFSPTAATAYSLANGEFQFHDLGPLPLQEGAPLGRQAQQHVLKEGRARGVEILVAIDAKGAVLAHGYGTRNRIGVPANLYAALSDPSETIIVHHNHPGNTAISNTDFAMLGLPGLRAIWAHGHGGAVSRVELTPAAHARIMDYSRETRVARLFNLAKEAGYAIYDPIQNAILADKVSLDEAVLMDNQIKMTILRDAGIIDYRSNIDARAFVEKVGLERYIENSVRAVRSLFYGEIKPALGETHGDDRSALALRHVGDLGASFADVADVAQRYPVETADDRRGARDDREEEGAPGRKAKIGRRPGFAEEPGAEGKPQLVIPGAERISDKELAERKQREAKRANRPQQPVEGLPLFDTERGSQGELFAVRSPWRNFPAVLIARDLSLAKQHPAYAAAKSGDVEAAFRLVNDLMTPETVGRIRAALAGRKPIVVPIYAEEATGQNKIPLAYAEALASHLGLEVSPNIVQVVRAEHTNAGAFERMARQPEFDGPVQPGQDYLIVDDTLTMGGTLANLRGYIESKGGNVVLASTLTGFGPAANIRLLPHLLKRLRRKHGEALEQFWQEQFGHGLDTLTQGEAGHLLKAPSLDSIRDRLAQGRRGGGVETAAGAASPRGGQEGGQIIPPKPEDDSGPSGAASDSGALFSLRQPETARERQAAMQGFLARGQPLDRALRIPFDIFGGVTRDGEWRPGARLFDRAARIIADAKFSPEGRFAFLNPYLEAARAGLIDHYGLDPDYVQRDRARALHERALMLRGAEFIKTLAAHNVGPAEARVLQAVLTGEQVSDAEMRALAEPIRAAIDQLGQEAVALGLVSAESFERNRGTYLHRVYMKYEAEQNGLLRTVNRIMGARRKKIIGEQFRGRGLFQEIEVARLMRDVPDWHEGARGKPQKGEKFIRLDEMPEQQSLALDDKSARERPLRTVWWPADQPIPPRYDDFRNEGVWEIRGEKGGKLVLWRDFTKAEREKMGEILDARYTIAKTFLLMAHDLATGRFYKDIAENEAWTRSAPPNERWVDAAEWAAQRQRYWKHGDIAWVKVPDSEIPNSGGKKQWGALAGKWVREEIWRDLNELQLMHRQHLWRALMTQWKLNKTARSPVVHMNNVVSNALLMDLLDVRWQDLARGIRSYLARDRYYQEAFEHGAFGADMMTQEIRDHVLKPVLNELLRSNTFQQSGHLGVLGQMSKFVELLWSKAMAIDQKMIDIYRIEDELFRMATYIRRRELGDTAQQAADHAREQFIDYDIRAPWVNIARNTVLPFLAYTYRAAPLVARAVATKPWKLAKYFALAYGANAFAYWLTGGDEDKERRVLPEREQGFTWIGAPRMLRMPLNDAYGNPLFLDIRRWIPAGDIFDMPDADILPAWLTPGGPLIIGGELFLNRSAFTGKEIRNDKTQDWWERRTSEADHLWKSWMPSAAWVPGSWYWEKIANAVQGATDRQGRPYSIPLAAASSVGIKLKPHDVEDAYARRGAEFASIERALESEARRLAAQHARKMISDAEFNRQMLRLMQKFERLSNRARETLQ